MSVEVLASQTTASISFPSTCFDPSDPAHASQHVSQETQTPFAHPRLASHHRPLPSVSRLPPSSPLQTHKQSEFTALMPSSPPVSTALPPPRLSNSARMQPQSIARPVVSLLNLAGKVSKPSRSDRDGVTLAPCRRIRHHDSTLPQFQYFKEMTRIGSCKLGA